MPYNDFTQQLAELQKVNLGSGFILQAQAKMMANQDEALRNTLSILNKSQQDLDAELKTTDQQIQEINDSDIFKEGVEDIEKTSAQYQAMLDASLLRQEKYQELYQKGIQDLISIGSEESLQQADALGKELPYKLQNVKDRMAIPMERLRFKQGMFELKSLKYTTEEAGIQLKALKQNVEVMSLVTNIMEVPTADGKSTWYGELVADMNFNEATGKVNYKERLNDFYEMINNELAGNPLRGEVIKAFDLELSKRVRNWRPPAPTFDSSGFERLQDEANYTLDLYGFLKEATYATGMFENDKDYAGTRKLYSDYATQYVTELKLDPNKDRSRIDEIMKFGSSKEVIARIRQVEDKTNYLQATRGDGMPTDHMEVLERINQYKYDKAADNYYWDKLTEFKKRINKDKDFKITPLIKAGVTPTGGFKYRHMIKDPQLMGKSTPLDLSEIMSNDTGWWNPHDPANLKTYGSMIYETMPAPNQPKQDQLGSYLTPQNMMVR